MKGKFKPKSINFLLLHHTVPHKIVAQSYWELTGGVYKIDSGIFSCSYPIRIVKKSIYFNENDRPISREDFRRLKKIRTIAQIGILKSVLTAVF
jgi:hypothetical protein